MPPKIATYVPLLLKVINKYRVKITLLLPFGLSIPLGRWQKKMGCLKLLMLMFTIILEKEGLQNLSLGVPAVAQWDQYSVALGPRFSPQPGTVG